MLTWRGRTQLAAALLLCANGLVAQTLTGSTAAVADPSARTTEARLDSLVRAATSEYGTASLSVAVVRGRDTLLNRAYGYAELSFSVPATTDTRYNLIGPGVALLAAAVLRAAEMGLLSLEDEAARYIPEFPWQGRRVTIRQLLDATSGLQDYHYLGDDYFRVARNPMRTDEVTALFAGRPFVHEPGADWSWTISGWFLAGIILERVAGEPYPDFLQREVLTPGGLTGLARCDGTGITAGLARGYRLTSTGFDADVSPSLTAVRFTRAFCGTATDVTMIPDALRRLLLPASYLALLSPQGAAMQGPRYGFGMGVDVQHEEQRLWWGGAGSALLGYSSSWLVFPADSLSVVVLANTQVSLGRLGRNLARAVLALPLIPPPASVDVVQDMPVAMTAEERRQLVGRYGIVPIAPPPQHRAWSETLCVYEELGRLMGQYVADPPFLLQKQEDSTFAMGAGTARLLFLKKDGLVVGADVLRGGIAREAGVRESETCASPAP